MVQLLPVTEPEMLARLNKIYKAGAQNAYVCIEKKEIKASCLYNLREDVCEIVNVSTVEPDIFDGLVRAVFESARMKGIDRAVFDEKMDYKMLERLGFVQDDTFDVNSLTNLTNRCGGCKNLHE